MNSNTSRTELHELGEFRLIDHLTKDFSPKNSSTLIGVGDDAAVIAPEGKQVVVSTDLLLEGIHFDLTYNPLKHLGYKSVVVNLSDIYAMNATPTQVTISIGVSKKFCLEDLEEFYAGVKLACERYGVDMVGGDTSASMTGLTISVTAIGIASRENICYRSGAKENDLICVTGNLGAAYMGLQLLEREKQVFLANPNAQPELQGFDYLIGRFLKPEVRMDAIEAMKKAEVKPTSMIDISDGLSSELLHICKNSNAGCRIYLDKIPIDQETFRLSEEIKIDPIIAALNGGEDYELLFTVPLSEHQKVEDMGVSIIGHITNPESGAAMVTPDGNEITLTAQGWNAIKPEE